MDRLAVDDQSSPEAKIALFRSLFRGREDVYARRFESRTSGKSGYSPACANEWLQGICEKPRVKCAACRSQQFPPVTMEHRPEIGLGSYDRFFPNQDTLPQGGFGNLIALPLQKGPRKVGNSVFVDAQCQPYADLWAFLSSVQRIPATTVEQVVREAGRCGL